MSSWEIMYSEFCRGLGYFAGILLSFVVICVFFFLLLLLFGLFLVCVEKLHNKIMNWAKKEDKKQQIKNGNNHHANST